MAQYPPDDGRASLDHFSKGLSQELSSNSVVDLASVTPCFINTLYYLLLPLGLAGMQCPPLASIHQFLFWTAVLRVWPVS